MEESVVFYSALFAPEPTVTVFSPVAGLQTIETEVGLLLPTLCVHRSVAV